MCQHMFPIRRLLANSISALIGCIEIYNKPRFGYRDEVSVVLLTNAWELALKALLSKGAGSAAVYYPKKRGEAYRTLTWQDTMNKCRNEGLWPTALDYDSCRANVRAVADFRDRAIHLENSPGFGMLFYALAQQSIVNYKDLLQMAFGRNLATEITWHLLPLGNAAPIKPLEFLNQPYDSTAKVGATEAEQFLRRLYDSLKELEVNGNDLGRVATSYNVTLQSVKKVTSADLVVGVSGDASDKFLVSKKSDPNEDFPFNMTRLLKAVNDKRSGRPITSHDYQVIVRKYDLKSDKAACWIQKDTKVPQWSAEALRRFRELSDADYDLARSEYRVDRSARKT